MRLNKELKHLLSKVCGYNNMRSACITLHVEMNAGIP